MSSRALAMESEDPGPQRVAEGQERKASDQGVQDLLDADGGSATPDLLPVSQLVDANAPHGPLFGEGLRRPCWSYMD